MLDTIDSKMSEIRKKFECCDINFNSIIENILSDNIDTIIPIDQPFIHVQKNNETYTYFTSVYIVSLKELENIITSSNMIRIHTIDRHSTYVDIRRDKLCKIFGTSVKYKTKDDYHIRIRIIVT